MHLPLYVKKYLFVLLDLWKTITNQSQHINTFDENNLDNFFSIFISVVYLV